MSTASTAFSASVTGTCTADLEYQEWKYTNIHLSILPGLYTNLILGVAFQYRGTQPPLSVCGFSTLNNMEPPEPFPNLTETIHPIATKSRRYSKDDLRFIKEEVERLLNEGIIESSKLPWRTQVVVTKAENCKKRLAIDYSQIINRFTELDAFPLPRINDLVNDIAQYHVFSTIDLWSAYHQVPLKEEDKPYTAFEARNNLYQFTCLPFGVTNGVACFQRKWQNLWNRIASRQCFLTSTTSLSVKETTKSTMQTWKISSQQLRGRTFATMMQTVSSQTAASLSLDVWLRKESLVQIWSDYVLSPWSTSMVPHYSKSLSRCLGLFSYYSQRIPEFSDWIKPLTSCKSFPLPSEAVGTFQDLKKMVEKSFAAAIDESIPFKVETDESEVTLVATLSLDGKPIAFFSRSLQGSELNHAANRKGSTGYHWSSQTLETVSDRTTLHLENRPEVCVIHVWPTPQREDNEWQNHEMEAWAVML